MEASINFDTQGTSLEGRLNKQSPTHGVVISHPHPLYGGNMNNFVVTMIAATYAEKGWSTLRFNFRGTGASSGKYEDGIGEQYDIQAAVDYLKSHGVSTIELAGYSFGAWVTANWSRNNAPHTHHIQLVSPPVAFVDFDLQTPIPGLKNIFSGQLDDIAPSAQIQSALPNWSSDAKFHLIEGADHFFSHHAEPLSLEIAKTIAQIN